MLLPLLPPIDLPHSYSYLSVKERPKSKVYRVDARPLFIDFDLHAMFHTYYVLCHSCQSSKQSHPTRNRHKQPWMAVSLAIAAPSLLGGSRVLDKGKLSRDLRPLSFGIGRRRGGTTGEEEEREQQKCHAIFRLPSFQDSLKKRVSFLQFLLLPAC